MNGRIRQFSIYIALRMATLGAFFPFQLSRKAKVIYFHTHTYATSKMPRIWCCMDNNIQRSSKRQRH